MWGGGAMRTKVTLNVRSKNTTTAATAINRTVRTTSDIKRRDNAPFRKEGWPDVGGAPILMKICFKIRLNMTRAMNMTARMTRKRKQRDRCRLGMEEAGQTWGERRRGIIFV